MEQELSLEQFCEQLRKFMGHRWWSRMRGITKILARKMGIKQHLIAQYLHQLHRNPELAAKYRLKVSYQRKHEKYAGIWWIELIQPSAEQ